MLLRSSNPERRCVIISAASGHLMMVSWGSLLDAMAARSSDNGEPRAVTQIRQLRSLARYADEGAFKPLPPGNEPGSDSEIRLRQYRRLVDAATEEGINQNWADRKRLRATPKPYGYGRYIRLLGTVVWFGINLELFEHTGKTPLWVSRWGSFDDEPDVSQELGEENQDWYRRMAGTGFQLTSEETSNTHRYSTASSQASAITEPISKQPATL